ncbi:S41 family peptidase [Pseudobdellovibrio sp. HCB154]|uniref:S41 family peptidase n=1 Tax=Pseudobdellovibrio sp. HCB154 TaxID=3386277 RepID=UPI00391736EC
MKSLQFLVFLLIGIGMLSVTHTYKEKPLPQAQISSDIDLLIHTLDEVYAGKVADPENFKILVDDLTQIKTLSLGQIAFFQKIQEALEKFPDGHLQAVLGDVKYKVSRTMASLPEKDKPEEDTQFKEIQINNKKALVVTIPTFLVEDPINRQNIINTLTEKSKVVDSLILDLRGNSGGYRDLALQIGAVLWGEPFRDGAMMQYYHIPVVKSREWYNKPIHKLRLNLMKSQHIANEYVFRVEKYLNDPEAIFSDASFEEQNMYLEEEMQIEKNGFAKPIYVLVDEYCASSCETMLDALEMHPYATSIGTKTAGAVKYGNPVLLTLPASAIDLLISTSYIEYIDKRNTERKGYRPKVFLKDDEDVMNKVISLVKQLP